MASLGFFALGERVLVVVTFILKEEFIRTCTDLFFRKGVMEMFLLGDRDVIYTLFGGFL